MTAPRPLTAARLKGNKPLVEPQEARLALYRSMLRMRRVEERIQALYSQGNMRCPTHLSIGQEAVAAGVCANLQQQDYVISAHRSHAHYIGKGGSLRAMFAELYGKVDGCASGKGGSMHLIDLSVNFLGCVPIVGSTIPIGVGAAFGASLQNRDPITAVFFGDAATEAGVFHESLNFAAVHRLPILFVCENNFLSVNSRLDVRQPANRTIADLGRGHGIEASQHDGQLVEAVHAATADAVAHIRAKDGPVLLEFLTYRWLEHCGPNDDIELGYRTREELNAWRQRCPVQLHRQLLEDDGLLDAAADEAIDGEIAAEIDDAVAFAEQSPFPPRDELMRDLYA
jgi:TPP-dependent pyruvate/acetoin dehydrogenase alpha subunit